MNTWQLQLTPRNWQKIALREWQKEQRGIVQVVTGGGKTVFAQLCLLEFFRGPLPRQALIIVPTISLLDQWFIALQEELRVPAEQVGLLSGQERPHGNEPVIIAVINSARNYTTQFAAGKTILLIVDECHRAGSPANSKATEGNFAATLGLSATPERDYDNAFHDLISPRLGPIVYEYTYREASLDGVISPFSLSNVAIELLADEASEYRRLTRQIAKSARISTADSPPKAYPAVNTSPPNNHANSHETHVKRLLQRRAAVSSNATMRVPVAVKLLEMHRGERAIVFHERISAANQIFTTLLRRRHRATIYHASLGPVLRRDNLRLFRNGVYDVLVCCRALDEGINVPEASVAVIASSSATQRQRIQRLGRILRKANNKDSATIYTIYATPEQRKRLEKEEAHLQGITRVTWFKGEMSQRD